jgi:hypothetical protein
MERSSDDWDPFLKEYAAQQGYKEQPFPEQKERRNQALDTSRLTYISDHAEDLKDSTSEASRRLAEGLELITNTALQGYGEDPWESIYRRLQTFVAPYQAQHLALPEEAIETVQSDVRRLKAPCLIIGGI